MNIHILTQLTSISGDVSPTPLSCFASFKTQIGLLISCTIREITENKVDLNCSQSGACTDCVFDIILSHRLEDIKQGIHVLRDIKKY